jgi:hypothetical protein
MTRSRILPSLLLCLLSVAGSAIADTANGKVSCEILENAEAASGEMVIVKDAAEIARGTCGKELNVPIGEYEVVLRLDGTLDSPESRQPLAVKKNSTHKLKADFETGVLEVRIASQGKRAAGMAIIKRGGQQIGTLGSGVPAHLSVGAYEVVARYRTQEKAWSDVKIVKGERATLDATFE